VIVTVQLPEGVRYHTDKWYLDPVDGWTVTDLCEEICAEVSIAGDWEVLLDAVPLTPSSLCVDVLSPGDVITLAEM